jgi:hypothetical protein
MPRPSSPEDAMRGFLFPASLPRADGNSAG